MKITAIILGISLSANLGIALGTNWNRFKNWLSEWILKIIFFQLHQVVLHQQETRMLLIFLNQN